MKYTTIILHKDMRVDYVIADAAHERNAAASAVKRLTKKGYAAADMTVVAVLGFSAFTIGCVDHGTAYTGEQVLQEVNRDH